YEKRAVIVFNQTLYTVRLARQQVEFWRAGTPSPYAVFDSRPEIALPVRIQIERAATKSAVVSVALNAVGSNSAEPSTSGRHSADPNGSFVVFKNLENVISGKLRILGELAILPTRDSIIGADPKSPVARDR